MATSKDAPAKFRPYIFQGLDLDYNDTQAQGPCPFCPTDRPVLGIKASTGQFRCVKCGTSGNIYSFISLLLTESLSRTTEADYTALSKDRGIPVESLKLYQFAKSIITGEWIIPGVNDKGHVASLYRIVQQPINPDDYPAKGQHLPVAKKTFKWVCMASPELKMHPFGSHLVKAHHTTVHVCEGVWDAPAMHGLLAGQRASTNTISPKEDSPRPGALATDTSVAIGVPGSGVFLPEYMHWLNGRDVCLWYDNDHPKKDAQGNLRLIKGKIQRPGWDGMQRAISIIQESPRRPRSVRQCLWTASPYTVNPSDRKTPASWPNHFYPFVTQPTKPLDGAVGYNPNLPDGFDVRDVSRALGQKALAYLLSMLDSVRLTAIKTQKDKSGGSIIEPIPRNSFEDLCKDWRDSLHFTQQLKDTLAISLAVVISTEFPTDALWFRIIGPPGSGKSTIAEAISAAKEYVLPKSVLRGFHSGYIGGEDAKERSEDASLIPAMQNKTIIMKDGDTLLNSPAKDKILSELRDIYDGTSRAHYLNRKNQDYEDIRTTFILCGTDTLRQLNRSSLGERFLDCEILGDEETSPYLDRAFGNTLSKLSSCMGDEAGSTSSNHEAYNPEKELFLKRVTYGFIKHLKENITKLPRPEFSSQSENQIKAMGQLLSYMRARVSREHGTSGELTHRPRVELATRIVAQFVKLAFCSALVLGRRTIDTDVISIVRKVLLDSAEGFQYEITDLLMSNWEIENGVQPTANGFHPDVEEKLLRGGAPARRLNDDGSPGVVQPVLSKSKKASSIVQQARNLASRVSGRPLAPAPTGLSSRQISTQLNLSESATRRVLDDLREFNIVRRASMANNSGQRGRDIHIWQPTEIMINLWLLAHGRQPPVSAIASNS